jgi:hypothetical protein
MRDHLAAGVAAVEAVHPGGVDQVLGRRQLLEERRIDADPVDQPLDGHLVAGDVVAEDLDASLLEGEQRAHQADQRRLAAAVGAEDAVDLTALDAQRDVVDGDDRLGLRPAAHVRSAWSGAR